MLSHSAKRRLPLKATVRKLGGGGGAMSQVYTREQGTRTLPQAGTHP